MRNTDRGADNYMLKYCEGNNERSLIDIAPSRLSTSIMPVMRERTTSESHLATLAAPPVMHQGTSRPTSSTSQDSGASPYAHLPHLHVRSNSLLHLTPTCSHVMRSILLFKSYSSLYETMTLTFHIVSWRQLTTAFPGPTSIPKGGDHLHTGGCTFLSASLAGRS